MSRKTYFTTVAITALLILITVPTTSAKAVLNVGEFFAQAEALSDQPVQVRGFVVDVCLHRGCKLFLRDLRDDANSTVRVERTAQTSPFSGTLTGDALLIRGIARTTRIDPAYLDVWEAEVRGSGRASTPADLGGCTEAKECDEDVEAIAARERTLEQIAGLRERVAASPRGYLISAWIDCSGFEKES
jgi:hypothetical protein